MKEITATDIEHINIVILIAGSILVILIMREFRYLFSFAVASAIMTLNFRLLKKIIEGVFGEGHAKKRHLFVRLPLKFLVFAGLITVVVIYGDIDILFFLIGLSTVFISIVINHLYSMYTVAIKRRQKDGT